VTEDYNASYNRETQSISVAGHHNSWGFLNLVSNLFHPFWLLSNGVTPFLQLLCWQTFIYLVL